MLDSIYSVLTAMVPLYVTMAVAFASSRWWRLFSPEQCSGINRFVAVFAVPLLSFHFISDNNPYAMNLRFLAADTLQKLIVLAALAAWVLLRCGGGGSKLDWVITVFSLATLPNTLIVGIPLLGGMYGGESAALMVQVVVLQCVIWYTLLLFLFECRAAVALVEERFPDKAAAISSFRVENDVVSLDGDDVIETEAQVGADGRLQVTVRRSDASQRSSAATGSPSWLSDFNSGYLSLAMMGYGGHPSSSGEQSSFGLRNLFSDQTPGRSVARVLARSSSAPQPETGGSRSEDIRVVVSERHQRGAEVAGGSGQAAEDGGNLGDDGGKQRPAAVVMTKLILVMVWRKLIRNPNTYASVLGLAWALIAFRWGLTMPKIVANSISILSDAGLGMAMFSLGLFMAAQPKVIACGNLVALISLVVRFVAGPTVMAIASLAVGLRGNLLRIAVVQAALPQGIVPFVFAKEYNNHPTILSTGVIFGMLVALPIDVMYYFLLSLRVTIEVSHPDLP